MLIISYYYPPLNDVGVLRSVGFGKYLGGFGYNPIILTVKNPDIYYCRVDQELRVTSGAYRSRSLVNPARLIGKANGLLKRVLSLFSIDLRHDLLNSLFLIPDFACGWIPMGILDGLRIVRNRRIDIIYATCKPNSCAVIGGVLSRLSKIPFVVDLRDPWRRGITQKMVGNTHNAYSRLGDKWRDGIDKRIEDGVLGKANIIVLTTKETKQIYEELYPHHKEKLRLIHNGYADEVVQTDTSKKLSTFTVVYSGSMYDYLDNSSAFFEALHNIVYRHHLGNDIRFLYIGGSAIVREMVDKYDISEIVHCTGYLNRRDAISLMQRAHVMLLKNIRPYLSTKLFEGLASGMPFISLIDSKSEALEILREYSSFHMNIYPSNTREIEDAIIEAYRRWRNGNLACSANREFTGRFSKLALTKQLAGVFDECLVS